MKILFLGPNTGTSLHRIKAFRRLGNEVVAIDPRCLLPETKFVDHVEWRIHPAPLAAWVRPRLLRALDSETFDLAFVDGGSLVGASLVHDLKARCKRVVNFNHDDPFGSRDGVRFAAYREAVPVYDMLIVVREENVEEANKLGAQKVLLTFRVADDVEHAPRPISAQVSAQWASDVAFVGTWMPERGPFLANLIQLGVPLSIFGARWEKAPEWPQLQRARRTPHLEGEDYCYAIQCAKICIGLLSVGNRDLHTTRSLEIPSLGSVLCAQRTVEHEVLYEDRTEAIFWSDANECAQGCKELLFDDQRRELIARRGRQRCLANGHFTNCLLTRIIEAVHA